MRPKPPTGKLKVGIGDLARVLGTHGSSMVRHQVESLATPEHKPYIKLAGESDAEAKARHEKEGLAITAMVWEGQDLVQALTITGLSFADWCRAVDRLDFAVRLEHHAALRAVVGAAMAMRVAVKIAADSDNDVETRLKAALGIARSYAKHDTFRSKITETLTKERSELGPHADPTEVEVLNAVIQELASVSEETDRYQRDTAEAEESGPRPKPSGVLEAEKRRLEELRTDMETNIIEGHGGDFVGEDGEPIEEDE